MVKQLVKVAKSSRGEMWRCEKLDGVRFNYPADKLAKWYLLPASVRPLPLLLPSPRYSASCVHNVRLVSVMHAHCAQRVLTVHNLRPN